MDNSLKLQPRVYVAIAFLGLLNSVVYSIPYIKAIFYDGMIAFTGSTNAQLGVLMTIYGIGEVVTLGIGGLLAEKLDCKKVITYSSIGTALGCFILAMAPSYFMTAVVWLMLVFTSLFMFWGSLFKALRLLGSDKVQGKIVGFYYGCAGVGYFLINMLLLFVYDKFSANSAAEGMRAVFFTLGAITVVLSVAAFYALKYAGTYEVFDQIDKPIEKSAEESKKGSMLTQWKFLMKNKGVWYFGGTLFCVYGMQISMQYFTPYFTEVLGVTVVFSGVVSVIRLYGMQALGSPMGGIIADKVGSSAKVVLIFSLLSALTILPILVFPAKWLIMSVIMFIIMISALFNGLNYGVQYSIVSEAGIPREYTAAAVGFGSSIGFLPDVFQHTLFGYWMDTWGVEAYKYIFMYGVAVAVLGAVLLASFLKYKKRILSS